MNNPHSPVEMHLSDWNRCDDVMAMTYRFREGKPAELSNLILRRRPSGAGKRYSSSNTSSHQFDWEYIQ
ncbi:hypothetical protein LNP74_05475 [Klebsiella pneumoniae subsp. pneumoniae]|nr:hypothetical protein [Klebsiella pneumoniae subsp. pneumoniae]